MTEELIDDLIELQSKQTSSATDLTEQTRNLGLRSDELMAEKKHLTSQLGGLEKDNESLKLKFSQLLD